MITVQLLLLLLILLLLLLLQITNYYLPLGALDDLDGPGAAGGVVAHSGLLEDAVENKLAVVIEGVEALDTGGGGVELLLRDGLDGPGIDQGLKLLAVRHRK